MTKKKSKKHTEPTEMAEILSKQQLPDKTPDLQTDRDDLMARLQRVSADYQNYQKRIQRDIEQARQFANEDIMKSLLAVIDDMERALQAARENHSPEDPLLQGMELVHNKLLETLGSFGLQAIEAEGKQFDPSEHLAMVQEESDAHPPLTVLKELQTGYTLRGRTIRPSAVVVSKEPQIDQPDDE